MKEEIKIKPWKQQFLEVKKIGEEPPMTPPPWKRPKTNWLEDDERQEPTKHST